MLSKSSTLVINAFVELAKLPEGQYQGARAIAGKIKAPPNYLGKLLQSFLSTGLVVSQKGLGGGFRLGKDAKTIKLYDIVQPIDNIGLWKECALGLKKCSDKTPCAVHNQWKGVREVYYDFLRRTSISDLIN